jgi:phage tail sheath gpL-like
MGIAVLEQAGAETARLFAAPPARPVKTVQLGKMWASPSPEGWRLQERLAPSWSAPS